jgi:hypothetical protein
VKGIALSAPGSCLAGACDGFLDLLVDGTTAASELAGSASDHSHAAVLGFRLGLLGLRFRFEDGHDGYFFFFGGNGGALPLCFSSFGYFI